MVPVARERRHRWNRDRPPLPGLFVVGGRIPVAYADRLNSASPPGYQGRRALKRVRTPRLTPGTPLQRSHPMNHLSQPRPTKSTSSGGRINGWGLLLICAFLWGDVGYAQDRLSDDATLITWRKQHATELEEMRAMLKQDPSIRYISTTEVFGGKGVSADRLQQYRALLRKLGTRVGCYSSKGDEVRWEAQSFGTVQRSIAKGVGYFATPPNPIVDTTDGIKDREKDFTAFRKIEDGWYVFLEYDR